MKSEAKALKRRLAQWQAAEERQDELLAQEGPLSPEETWKRGMRILDFCEKMNLRSAPKTYPEQDESAVMATWSKLRQRSGIDTEALWEKVLKRAS